MVPLAGAVVVIALPFLGADAFVTLQVLLIAVMAMTVSSLNLSLGYAGELALGQVAVYAVGAYIAGDLGVHGHTDVLLQLLAGGGRRPDRRPARRHTRPALRRLGAGHVVVSSSS